MVFKKLFLMGAVVVWLAAAQTALAFDFNLKGSLGEGGHKTYVPPVSNPLFNETPYITTELRPIWIRQGVPGTVAGLPVDGTIDVIALQARVALTERLGFIATKDGYANLDFDNTLTDDEGFVNIAFGFKYALINRPEDEGILTIGIEYEAPSGNLIEGTTGTRLQGGRSKGFLDFFVTGAKRFGKLGLQSNIGLNQAMDTDVDTSLFHAGAHADFEIHQRFFPFVEGNVYTVVNDANRTPPVLSTVEGADLVNLGASNAGTVATVAGGFRYHLLEHILLGWSYEVPMSGREDLFNWRSTLDMVIYY
ncbi:hypothetical protein [Nitrospina gracilis]|uniref:hypothetical protein n=1 Tax=Nitrospina gracilis TaxID=35801 RepID=UPI001F395B0C|nr:hypothetical protein [Nitrospina gracilis]MCF8719317.1 hypothetical protein [Nitrospina gracilis Nb-211]